MPALCIDTQFLGVEYRAHMAFAILGNARRRGEPLRDGQQREVRYKSVLGYSGYSEDDCGKAAGRVESLRLVGIRIAEAGRYHWETGAKPNR